MKKWILKVFFSTCMLLMLFSVPAVSAEAANVTVGGTTLNKDEYVKKDFTKGSATDYNFYFSGGKLILNDADGIGSIHADGDLILELSGSSSVSDGIFVDGDLTIEGDGTLTATATPLSGYNEEKTYGIKANRLTINNGTITANGGGCERVKGYDYAIYADIVIINGGLTTVNGAESNSIQGYTYGIYAVSSVTVNSGILNAYGGIVQRVDGKSSAVTTDNFTVNNNSVVNIKGGDFFGIGNGYGLESPNIIFNGGCITLEAGYSHVFLQDCWAVSSIPKIPMPLGIWKDSLNGEYSLASITPYAPDHFYDITYLNVKHIEAVVTPQLQINSTTGEWEVSYNDGQNMAAAWRCCYGGWWHGRHYSTDFDRR